MSPRVCPTVYDHCHCLGPTFSVYSLHFHKGGWHLYFWWWFSYIFIFNTWVLSVVNVNMDNICWLDSKKNIQNKGIFLLGELSFHPEEQFSLCWSGGVDPRIVSLTDWCLHIKSALLSLAEVTPIKYLLSAAQISNGFNKNPLAEKEIKEIHFY